MSMDVAIFYGIMIVFRFVSEIIDEVILRLSKIIIRSEEGYDNVPLISIFCIQISIEFFLLISSPIFGFTRRYGGNAEAERAKKQGAVML